jgi:hypothetical protein
MSQSHLPPGCHDAQSTAELLNMSKKALLKAMREMGWLIVGTDEHNLPRREYIACGWLTTQDRGYCLKGKKEIGKSYRVMLVTQAGFIALKAKLNNHQQMATAAKEAEQAKQRAPTAKKLTPEVSAEPENVKPFNRSAAEAERKKMLQQMADWNLPIAAGRN